MKIVGDVKEKCAQHAAVEAADKVVASRNDRHRKGEPLDKKSDAKKEDGLRALLSALATTSGAFGATVDGCW